MFKVPFDIILTRHIINISQVDPLIRWSCNKMNESGQVIGFNSIVLLKHLRDKSIICTLTVKLAFAIDDGGGGGGV